MNFLSKANSCNVREVGTFSVENSTPPKGFPEGYAEQSRWRGSRRYPDRGNFAVAPA